jgi:hypothetical protein
VANERKEKLKQGGATKSRSIVYSCWPPEFLLLILSPVASTALSSCAHEIKLKTGKTHTLAPKEAA